jgi:hypothetical protein
LGADYGVSVLRLVLDYRGRASSGVNGRLNRELDRLVRVPGFRHAAKAPSQKILDLCGEDWPQSASLLEAVLNVWLEAHVALRQQVADYLALPENKLSGVFRNDKLTEGWSEAMTTAIEHLQIAAPSADKNDIALMLCCLTPARDVIGAISDPDVANSETDARGNDEPSEALPEKSSMNTSSPSLENHRFAQWLKELTELPAQAPEWDALESFLEAAQRLATARRETLAQAHKWREGCGAFCATHQEGLRHHEQMGCVSWPDRLPTGEIDVWLGRLEDLGQLLVRYTEVFNQPAMSRAERRARRAQLDSLEEDIDRLCQEIEAALTQVASPAEPEQQLAENTSSGDAESYLPAAETQVVTGAKDEMPESTQAGFVPEPTLDEAPPRAEEVVCESEPTTVPETEFPAPPAETPPALDEASLPAGEDEALPVTQSLATDSAWQAAALCQSQDPEALRALQWQLLLEDKLGLAFHLARSLAAQNLAELPPALVRAVALGPHLRYSNGLLARLLKEDFASLEADEGGGGEREHGLRFLWTAAALRPALLAPDTGAAGVLQTLRFKGLDKLFGYCQAIIDFANRQQVLDPNALKNVRDADAWQADLARLSDEVNAWRAHAPKMTMTYAPATAIWRTWQKPGQLVDQLLQPILAGDANQADALRQALDGLLDMAHVRREINNAYQRLGQRGPGIIAKADNQIRNHLHEAVLFAQRWLELQATRPGRERTYARQQVENLSAELRRRHAEVEVEGDAFVRRHDAPAVRAGWQLCRRALQDLRALFQGQAAGAFEEPAPEHLLHADWLRHPTQPLDEQGQPEGDPAELLPGLLDLIKAGPPDWAAAFEARCQARNHEATERILVYLTTYPDATAEVEALRQKREQHLAECRAALRREAEETQREVGRAIDAGLLREKEQVELAAEIEQILQHEPETVRFDEPRQRLQAIREALHNKRAEAASQVRERLAQADLETGHPAVARIRQALEQGDAATANEYLDMAQRGQPVPADDASLNVFAEFFPETFCALVDFAEPKAGPRPDVNKILADLNDFGQGRKRNYEIGPLNLERVAGDQALQVAEMLEAWFTAKRGSAGNLGRLTAKKILRQLGFNPSELDLQRDGQRVWLNFDCTPLNDHNLCPVPAYGSQAHGRYRVLCVWDDLTEDDLGPGIGDTSHGKPALVFYFGRMTEPRRLNVARLCRNQRRTFIVLDDLLLWFLCAAPSPRLSRFFECALPFTYAEPYTTAASLVPVEMFYGRERERASIINPLGACFIYGGRQLGKTALLRDVQRRFHNPEQGQVALWFDINTHGICLNKDIDDLWGQLALELKPWGVVPANSSAQTSLDKLLKEIKLWLEKDATRRLLLLLDEADRFLASDGAPKSEGRGAGGDFFRVARLKSLMDETGRRFKVVFAGLHDVQRTTRLANHPLAHYGDSVCIGPLLNNGEQRQARALIEKPLASLGYVFESADLVTRILWQTNYYPSLIQLYCEHLLRHLTEQYDAQTKLPCASTARHVEEVYSDQNLRKAIRQRFMLTLQLDTRYEVIAYLLAFFTLAEAETRAADGFSVDWVRREAVAWWPEGFQGRDSLEDVRVLLDEMVGLGILRVVREGRYALRSANVTYLMGTEKEIEAALERNREAPMQYEPATFRAALHTGGNTVDMSSRSPLTAEQESYLRRREHGATLIVGCSAAGLDDLSRYLHSSFGPDFFVDCAAVTELEGFVARLAELNQRPKDGATLLFVPPSCAWDETWVETWQQKRFQVQAAFVAGPEQAWNLAARGVRMDGITWLTLRVWHDAALRHWLDDCGLPCEPEQRQALTKLTGNWPRLLREFYQRAAASGWQTGVAALEEWLALPETARALLPEWGVTDAETQRFLTEWAELGEATSEELASVLEGMLPPATVEKRVRWAEWLGLAQFAPGDKRCLNPAVAALLRVGKG